MEMRTRFLPHLNNAEAEAYLEQNDIIIVPVGTVEMHGGLPLDCETVVSEGIAVRMAEACDGLVLPNLPYFYSGATASGRGTTQVSVRAGIDYLYEIAKSLLRQGFKRQIYISMHGPAHMTCSPVVRDFFDETGVPILYMDLGIQLQNMMKEAAAKQATEGGDATPTTNFFGSSVMTMFDAMILAGYDTLGRLDDVPLTTEFYHPGKPQSCAQFDDLFGSAYQSGAIGYCYGEHDDHMSTSPIPTAEARQELADQGAQILDALVASMDMPHVVEQMRNLAAYEDAAAEKWPWMPSAPAVEEKKAKAAEE